MNDAPPQLAAASISASGSELNRMTGMSFVVSHWRSSAQTEPASPSGRWKSRIIQSGLNRPASLTPSVQVPDTCTENPAARITLLCNSCQAGESSITSTAFCSILHPQRFRTWICNTKTAAVGHPGFGLGWEKGRPPDFLCFRLLPPPLYRAPMAAAMRPIKSSIGNPRFIPSNSSSSPPVFLRKYSSAAVALSVCGAALLAAGALALRSSAVPILSVMLALPFSRARGVHPPKTAKTIARYIIARARIIL